MSIDREAMKRALTEDECACGICPNPVLDALLLCCEELDYVLKGRSPALDLLRAALKEPGA